MEPSDPSLCTDPAGGQYHLSLKCGIRYSLARMARDRAQNVTKVFAGDVVALDDVSLRIEDGEFIALVGPSGCGKSTLLRALAGLEEVTSGSISIDGRDVTDLAPRHRDVAMVFQSYALYPHMSVRQNLGYGLKVRRTREGRDPRTSRGGGAACWASPICSSASPPSSPAVSASGSPWVARSSVSPRRSSWTSRSRTSTRSSASACARRSRSSTSSSAPRRSTSRTTRSRR